MTRFLRQRLDFYGNVLAVPRPFVSRTNTPRENVVCIGLCAPHGELLLALTFDLRKRA